MSGYLEMAIGPMFAGKTSWIIRLYNQYKFYTKNIVVINFSGDERYSRTELSNHDKIMIPCIHTTKLKNIVLPSESEVIFINEGQFFDDIVEWVKDKVDNENKKIYICGLDGDFKRNKFGSLLDLIPHCDKIQKLNSLCSNCKDGTPAIFSHRICDDNNQVLIGNDNYYIPLCRSCYKNFNKSI